MRKNYQNSKTRQQSVVLVLVIPVANDCTKCRHLLVCVCVTYIHCTYCCVFSSYYHVSFVSLSFSLYAAVSRSLGSVQDQLTAVVQSATDTALKDGIASILHTKVPFHFLILLYLFVMCETLHIE